MGRASPQRRESQRITYDREPPTRRIPATPPPPDVRDPAYVVADPEREQLRDSVRSLRTALALTALIAVAALGLALYTLLADDEEQDTGRRGASPARVAALSDRVNDLEDRVEDRATKNAVAQLEQRQEELAEQVEQAGEGGDTEALQESIDQLSADVQALEQRVDELAAQQEEGTVP